MGGLTATYPEGKLYKTLKYREEIKKTRFALFTRIDQFVEGLMLYK